MTAPVPTSIKLLNLLAPHSVYLPKKLVQMHLCDSAILVVSEIITDNCFKTPKEVKQIISNVDNDYIALLCNNEPKKIEKCKKDIKKVIANFDNIFEEEV
jgi:hypothetical protein